MIILKEKSFTLIELLIVIAIVGILAGIVIMNARGANEAARDAVRAAHIDQMKKALWMETDMGEKGYPIQSDWCYIGGTGDNACSQAVNDMISIRMPIPDDPIVGHHYMYRSNGTGFDLCSNLESVDKRLLFETSTQLTARKDMVCVPPEDWVCQLLPVPASNPCGEGWVPIPGTSSCVMKYEAKIQGNDDGTIAYNSSFVAESRMTGTPWVNISQIQAKAECEAIGAHLITNPEWMILARNIEDNVCSNKVEATTPDHSDGLYVLGNSNGEPQGAFPASTDDDGYYMTGDSLEGQKENEKKFSLIEEAHAIAITTGGGSQQRRTYQLLNGFYIWDFSGNAQEWVDATLHKNNLPVAENPVGWWGSEYDYTGVTDWGGVLQWDDVAQQDHSIRLGVLALPNSREPYPADDYFAFIRGGYNELDNYTHPGPYFLDLFYSPNGSNDYTSFRCVKSIP